MVAVITYDHPITSPTRMSVSRLSVAQSPHKVVTFQRLLLITQKHPITANRPTDLLNKVQSVKILLSA
jgi:hypothetical protein